MHSKSAAKLIVGQVGRTNSELRQKARAALALTSSYRLQAAVKQEHCSARTGSQGYHQAQGYQEHKL